MSYVHAINNDEKLIKRKVCTFQNVEIQEKVQSLQAELTTLSEKQVCLESQSQVKQFWALGIHILFIFFLKNKSSCNNFLWLGFLF